MAEKIVGRMPLWVLFFIASSGVFITLSFPFNIFAFDFKNGLVLTNMTAIETLKSFDGNFKPFILVNYLGGSFPSGIIEIILLSLVIGTLIYLCYDVCQWINHRPKILFEYLFPARAKSEPKKIPMPTLSDAEWKPYVEWLRAVNMEGYFDVLQSLKWMTEGLLYGTETFLFFNIVRISNIVILYFIDGMSELSHIGEPGAWLGLSTIFVLVSYGLFKLFPPRLNRAERIWKEIFRNAQDHQMRGYE
jgi:hypothetical protein